VVTRLSHDGAVSKYAGSLSADSRYATAVLMRPWRGKNRSSVSTVVLRMFANARTVRAVHGAPVAIAAQAVVLIAVLTACGGTSGSSTSSTMPATFSTAANPVQRENARPGTPGWEIPADAGKVITGYASETSVAAGQGFRLHVAAPPGSRYRVLVYRLGWYQGTGGRLIMCVPGCHSSQAATAQPRQPHPTPSPGCSEHPGA